MAKSFKEIGKKAEALIEQGKEADQKVQSCQARVASSNSRVAAARRQLASASETDEDGNPVGDVEQARVQLSMAEHQLAASQRALSSAQGDADRVRQQKNEHVHEIEKHNQTEKSNLDKLRKLKSSAFGADSSSLAEGIAKRLNEAEDARVALLRSMGIEATPDHVAIGDDSGTDSEWRGGGFATLDTVGQVHSYQGGGSEGTAFGSSVAAPVGGALSGYFGAPNANQEIQNQLINNSQIGEIPSAPIADNYTSNANESVFDPLTREKYYNKASSILSDEELTKSQKLQMLNELRNQIILAAQIETSKLEAGVIKEKVKVLRLTDNEQRERGIRYIEEILDIYRDNLLGRGIQEGKDLDDFISVLRIHYRDELEKDIAGLPNQLYEDPNYDNISKVGLPFVLGMYNTLSGSRYEDVREMYKKYSNKVSVCDTNYLGTAHYKANQGVFFFKTQVAKGDGQMDKPYQTAFHEFGHNIDYLIGGGSPISESWGNNELYRAICKDFETLRGDRTNEQLVADLKKEMEEKNWTLFQIGSVSDILECMTGIDYPLGSGHGSKFVQEMSSDGSVVERKISYWQNRLPNKEFFAETLDGAAANEESYLMMKQFFPNAVSVVHKIIGG